MKSTCHLTEEFLRFRLPRISQSIMIMVLALVFHTKDPGGVGYAVNIFFFLDLSPTAGYKAVLITRCQDIFFSEGRSRTFSTPASR